MTETEVKRIEDQIKDLQAQVKQYYKDKEAQEILEVEQKYLGKIYKKKVDGREVYVKVVSAICRNAPYSVRCIEFSAPVDKRYIHKGVLYAFHGYIDSFDYDFADDPFIWSDEELLKDIDTYEPIHEAEFRNIYDTFCRTLLELICDDYSLVKQFGRDYVQKIKTAQEAK